MKRNFNILLQKMNKNEYSTDQETIQKFCIDWRGKYKGTSDLIFFPSTVAKIIEIVKFCNTNRIPIVPQGGNTSLVGGSVPRNNKGEIILNLSKLNKIRDIDNISNTITVESGCILENINEKLNKYQHEMPISLGSKGSCHIGGNIATNAGGLNVIKYGSIRTNILGIEAVLPNGELFSDLKTVKKNNTGLDLKQLLIGAEGTLGIITAAVLKTYKKVNDRVVVMLCFNEFNKVLDAYVNLVKLFGELITAFEFMNDFSISLINKFDDSLKLPFTGKHYCLVELTNFLDVTDYNNFIYEKLAKINFIDTELIISKSENENKNFWKIREDIPLAEKQLKNIIQHDVSLPLKNIESFINISTNHLKQLDANIKIINFGHLGDNNLHFNVFIDKNVNNEEYKFLKEKINEIIFSNVSKYDGSISAEHGIGQLRRKQLKKYKSPNDLRIMKQIKKIYDPNNIMNPGKVF